MGGTVTTETLSAETTAAKVTSAAAAVLTAGSEPEFSNSHYKHICIRKYTQHPENRTCLKGRKEGFVEKCTTNQDDLI